MPRTLSEQHSAWCQRVALLVSVLTLASISTHGRTAEPVTQERDVGDFAGVVFSGSGDLYIVQGEVASMRIQAEQKILDIITTRVRDGVLYIGRKEGSRARTHRNVRVDLTVTSLHRLSIAGSGDAFAGPLEADDFSLTISGSADAHLETLDAETLVVAVSGSGGLRLEELQAQTFEATISGSGKVVVSGNVASQSGSISGSGDLVAGDLRSERAVVNVVGSGSADVWVTEDLEVSVTGSGDVYYRGNPTVRSWVTGSGELKYKGSRHE